MDYNNTRWKNKRKYILKRDGYTDRELMRYGRRVPANTVHHIFPAQDYPELAFVDWNLISLSQSTHNEMHDRDSHDLTDKGLALQKRYFKHYKRWCEDHGVAVRSGENDPPSRAGQN